MGAHTSKKLLTILLTLSFVIGFIVTPSFGARASEEVKLSINKTKISVICGQSYSLKATLSGSTSSIVWKSKDLKIATVDSNGKVTAKQAGCSTISASAAGVTAECEVQVLYKDVTNKNDFWFAPTNYLTNKGVVKGYDNQTLFKPANKCTRAQMVTFIWRLSGEPAPKANTCKFKDVKKSDYFYKACIWGNENHIVEGYKDGTFGPQIVCAKKHAVTFLWRLAGKPDPVNARSKFSDVKKSDYFYNATIWASEKGILAGYSDGTFKPDGDCLRRQMVTFLYKYEKNKDKAVDIDFPDEEDNIINIMSFTVEVPDMVKAYFKAHPEVAEKYEIKDTVVATAGGGYQTALDNVLPIGGADAPDIYCAEPAFLAQYTIGDGAKYAASYDSLGIKSKDISDAKIAKYIVDNGTRSSDGKIVCLGYQSTACAMIYRRDIAKEVFGTDDPSVISKECGPGIEKFFEAAEKCNEKGYAMISGVGDLWNMCKANGTIKSGWVNSKGRLVIDPERKAFLDYAKKIVDNGYSNGNDLRSEGWYEDMAGKGDRQVFCYLGPSWLINSVMERNCGSWKETGSTDSDGNPVRQLDKTKGTYGKWAICDSPIKFYWGGTYVFANRETDKPKLVADIIRYITLDYSKTGLQYSWAKGLLSNDRIKDTVASGKVMDTVNGKLKFLDRQNMFDVYAPAGDFAIGYLATPYDEDINKLYFDQVKEYISGEKTKQEAIEDFKEDVSDYLDIDN